MHIVASAASPSVSAVQYAYPNSSKDGNWNGTVALRSTIAPHAMTIDNLRVTLSSAPGASKSFTFTLMKNGVATALTCTVSDAATTAQDLDAGHAVTFAQGDLISMRSTPAGTPSAPTYAAWNMRQVGSGDYAVMGGSVSDANTTTVQYNNIMGTHASASTESDFAAPIATTGTFRNLNVRMTAAAGASKSYSFELMKNSVATGVIVNLSGTGSGNGITIGKDTTNSIAVVAGDIISLRITPTGTPTAIIPAWSCTFSPTNAGESFLMFASNFPASGAVPSYEVPNGRGNNNWLGTEPQFLHMGQTNMTAMYVRLITAPGASKSRSFRARVNATNSSLVAIVSDIATTASTTGSLVALSNDFALTVSSTPTNSPPNTTVKIGILLNDNNPYLNSGSFFGVF